MMFRKTSLFVLSLLVFSISFVSAQWVGPDVFIEVTSAQAGNEAQGCAVASYSGMLASLGNPKIGSDPAPIIKALRAKICPPDQWPPATYDLMSAVLHFLYGVL